MPRPFSTSNGASTLSACDARPSVITGGCSRNRNVSGALAFFLASTSACCSAAASRYPTRPSQWARARLVLVMDGHSVDGMGGFSQRFRQRRMREHRVLDALAGRLVRQGDAGGGEELGGLRADDVDAEHLVVLLVDD